MSGDRTAMSGDGAVPVRAAFFDVDKTLLPGSSLYLFARGLYRRGFYTLRDIAGFAFGQFVFRLTGAEGQSGMEAARESALAFVEGKQQADLVQLGHDIVVEVIGPRIYPGMRRVIEAHHATGDRTYLVTAAPHDLAEEIAAYLGMDGALGTRAELVDGTYTGKMLGPVLHGPAKLDAVRALADEEGIDLESSSAYSDSVNDRPLLEGVGHPVAVNPDRALHRLADEQGWPVHDFRRHRRLWLVWLPSGVALLGTAAAVVARRRAIRADAEAAQARWAARGPTRLPAAGRIRGPGRLPGAGSTRGRRPAVGRTRGPAPEPKGVAARGQAAIQQVLGTDGDDRGAVDRGLSAASARLTGQGTARKPRQ
jgi:HAD superfamily hydrolase (TIGR01490 family)